MALGLVGDEIDRTSDADGRRERRASGNLDWGEWEASVWAWGGMGWDGMGWGHGTAGWRVVWAMPWRGAVGYWDCGDVGGGWGRVGMGMGWREGGRKGGRAIGEVGMRMRWDETGRDGGMMGVGIGLLEQWGK
jgi:hypothetical protein